MNTPKNLNPNYKMHLITELHVRIGGKHRTCNRRGYMLTNEQIFKAQIVELILKKEADEALEALGQHYSVDTPQLKVGMPKESGGKTGCYVSKTKTIHVASQDQLEDPFVILHEFYHHLRMQGGKHKGTEKLANRFAEEFISAFQGAHRHSFRVSYKYGN